MMLDHESRHFSRPITDAEGRVSNHLVFESADAGMDRQEYNALRDGAGCTRRVGARLKAPFGFQWAKPPGRQAILRALGLIHFHAQISLQLWFEYTINSHFLQNSEQLGQRPFTKMHATIPA